MDGLQRLWAPWRYGYIADEGDGVDGCPFCVLPARGDDRANLILARGDHAYVIFNAWPYNPGHLMVVPFAHVGRLEDLDAAASHEVWDLGGRAVTALERTLSCQGVNLGMNLGDAAGAGIADHLHLHTVPRWFGDTNFISTVAASRVLPRALEEMYDVVRAGFGG